MVSAVQAALLHPKGAGLSRHQIAEHIGISQPTLSSWREKLAATDKLYQSLTRTSRDGRTINVRNIGRGRAGAS